MTGAYYSGCFKTITTDTQYGRIEGTAWRSTGIEFNASNMTSIYGGSRTVQPPALAQIPQIKY